MKTFTKFLMEVKHNSRFPQPISIDAEDTNIDEIIRQLNHDQRVKLALHCAEDVFQYVHPMLRKSVRNCLDAIKSGNKTNIGSTRQILLRLNDPPAGDRRYTDWATYCAREASSAAFLSDNRRHTLNSMFYASNARRITDDDNWLEYVNFARHLLDPSTSTVDKNPLKQFGTLESPLDIAAMLDHLEDVGEDIVIHSDNGLVLNLLPGLHIFGKNKIELAEKLLKNRSALQAFKDIYEMP